MKNLERRITTAAQIELRAGEGAPVIEGYAVVFNSRSLMLMWDFYEMVLPGAFLSSINNDDVRALWNHDSARVIGRTKSGTLRLREDEIGLRVEIDPPATALSEIESIKRGDVDQMSFGFEALDWQWDTADDGVDLRIIRTAKLYEVSPVTFPAYPATSVSVRDLPRAGGDDGYISDTFGFIPDVPGRERALTANNENDALRLARARVDVARRRLNLRGKYETT